MGKVNSCQPVADRWPVYDIEYLSGSVCSSETKRFVSVCAVADRYNAMRNEMIQLQAELWELRKFAERVYHLSETEEDFENFFDAVVDAMDDAEIFTRDSYGITKLNPKLEGTP